MHFQDLFFFVRGLVWGGTRREVTKWEESEVMGSGKGDGGSNREEGDDVGLDEFREGREGGRGTMRSNQKEEKGGERIGNRGKGGKRRGEQGF